MPTCGIGNGNGVYFQGPTYCQGYHGRDEAVGGVDSYKYYANSEIVWDQCVDPPSSGTQRSDWTLYLQMWRRDIDGDYKWMNHSIKTGYTTYTSPSRRTWARNGMPSGSYRIYVTYAQGGYNITGSFVLA